VKEEFERALREIAAPEDAAVEYAVIPASAIEFSDKVREACETNACGNYNRCWTCPPACGSVGKHKEKITSYPFAFVFSTKFALEDSFDYEGMTKAKAFHDKLTSGLHEKFGKTNPVYGAGGCTLCGVCAYPDPCVYPGKTFASVEAAGINVTALSLSAGLRYNNGENTVTYFSMILF
jgi:predicted metal-binding protein